MCPNCPTSGVLVWIGPGMICLAFAFLAYLFFQKAKEAGVFEGDEEEPKYTVFEE